MGQENENASGWGFKTCNYRLLSVFSMKLYQDCTQNSKTLTIFKLNKNQQPNAPKYFKRIDPTLSGS